MEEQEGCEEFLTIERSLKYKNKKYTARCFWPNQIDHNFIESMFDRIFDPLKFMEIDTIQWKVQLESPKNDLITFELKRNDEGGDHGDRDDDVEMHEGTTPFEQFLIGMFIFVTFCAII